MGMTSSIGAYALLSDCQSAALVSRDGSVDWWCAPRFDSRSCFARLLDERAGHWAVHPIGDYEVSRAYVPGTMVLRTEFRTATGTVRVTDALALSDGDGHEIGRASPHVLARQVDGLAGQVDLRMEFCPRLEYGLTVPWLRRGAGCLETVGGPDRLRLFADQDWDLASDGRASVGLVVRAGQSHGFTLTHREGMVGADAPRVEATKVIEEAAQRWQSWSDLHSAYQGFAHEQVRLGALVLRALTYAPTGAVVAAATTSLPAIIGGDSNWDYRFGWLRDSSITLKALWIGACPDEAEQYFRWMALSSGAGAENRAQIMFGVAGERDLTERKLDHLDGYANSTPVRVGNDAWHQRQLDVLGQVLEAAWVLRERLDFDSTTATYLRGLADTAADTWHLPDSGTWEGREGERHYVASKLMCWVALDRACALSRELDAEDRLPHWQASRERLAQAILDDGWNDDVGAFTGAFGSDHLDAAVLLIPLVGFLPATDERVRRTIDTVERELGVDGLLRRWTGAEDGAFVICSYWLAECLAQAGELDRARAVFDRVTGYANDVGLLAEQIDFDTGELLSNFPQTFSHAGLINAAWAIDRLVSVPDG